MQEYTLYSGYMEKMFNQECINSFDEFSNYMSSEPLQLKNNTTTEDKGPNSHMYCYDDDQNNNTQMINETVYMNNYEYGYLEGESNKSNMTQQVLYDYPTYESSAPSSPDSSLTYTSPHYSPLPSPNEMDLTPTINVSPHDVNHSHSLSEEKIDQSITDGNNTIHSLDGTNTIHHIDDGSNGLHSLNNGNLDPHNHSHMNENLIHNHSLSDESLIQSHHFSQCHFPQQSIGSQQLIDDQLPIVDMSAGNNHAIQHMKHDAPCLLLSHFKQEKLEKILDQEKQKVGKEGLTKDCPHPRESQSKHNEDPKMLQQYFVPPNASMNDSMNRKVLPNTYLTENQAGFGHVAIATIGNNIPVVQGNNTIILHPFQTMYPLSTAQLSNFFANPYMSTDFKSFDGIESKKRARMSGPSEKERRVRPKVIPEKGAIQCKGFNRKKKTQCKNAALMEYVGPRPLYCAEHIDLDTECLYTKCKSPFNKSKDDDKGCREVVLKEFKYCHKHYYLSIEEMMNDPVNDSVNEAKAKLERAKELLKDLETEAMKAKRTDPDLFQRKHKLIPKFQQIIRTLTKFLNVPKANAPLIQSSQA